MVDWKEPDNKIDKKNVGKSEPSSQASIVMWLVKMQFPVGKFYGKQLNHLEDIVYRRYNYAYNKAKIYKKKMKGSRIHTSCLEPRNSIQELTLIRMS